MYNIMCVCIKSSNSRIYKIEDKNIHIIPLYICTFTWTMCYYEVNVISLPIRVYM